MSSRPDQYPNQQRKYPNDPSEASAAESESLETLYPARPSFEPRFEAELYRLAPSRVTVLLVGGSEALKLEIAEALHGRSPRADHPFVRFDCARLDSDAVELTLFGGPVYAPARSGAIFEAAAGTLYVAAIEDLPLLTQPRFLRFLDQERQARVVASVNNDLSTRVKEGHFRKDLAERLTLVELQLPGAR